MPFAPRWGLATIAAAATAAPLLAGCSDDPTRAPAALVDAGDDSASDAGEDAGPRPGACAPGELALASGGCQPAGIPPEACGEGFAPTPDRACDAILPAAPCAPGELAIPGQTACKPVAPCGAGTWGDIPVEADTQFVDGSFTGASDGSASAPWTSVQAAVDAAEPGAIVAIAAGAYPERVLVVDKPIRLWGKCPAEVEIAGTDPTFSTVYMIGGSGSEIRDLAVTSTKTEGVSISGAVDVVLDRVWIHDTAAGAFQVAVTADPSSASVRDSLLENNRTSSIYAFWGAAVTVERSVLRDTLVDADGVQGRGVMLISDVGTARTSLTMRRSVVERSREEGILAVGSDLDLDEVVVRDTEPSDVAGSEGAGVVAISAVDDDHVSSFVVRRSVVERSVDCGVCAFDAATTLEDTVVRDVAARASDGEGGLGVALANDHAASSPRPQGSLRSVVIERAHTVGLATAAVEATAEAVWVRDIAAAPGKGKFGRGVAIEVNPQTGVSSVATLRGVLVEGSHETGVVVVGSDATIESTAIRASGPRPDGSFGRGLVVQLSIETLARGTTTLRQSLVDGAFEAGVYVAGADLHAQDSIVRGVKAQEQTGLFGDGLIVSAIPTGDGSARAELERCAIDGSARAAIAAFGAEVSLATSVMSCNPLDLDGEQFVGPYDFVDLGGNLCGCEGEANECIVLSTGLAAPEPI